jgi:hAT family protein
MGWVPKWIATAKKLICDEFDHSYHFQDNIVIDSGVADQPTDPMTKNIFDNLPVFHAPLAGTIDELTCYLNTMPEDIKNEDVLKWWYKDKHVFPLLHRMALDYHSVPSK